MIVGVIAGRPPSQYTNDNRRLVDWFEVLQSFLADRTNGRAYATLLRPSVVVVCRL